MNDHKVAKAKAEESVYAEAFPGLDLTDDEEEEETDKPVAEEGYEIFYLWDISEVLFNIYKTVSYYLLEHHAIDSAVAIALVKDTDLPLKDALTHLAYIHSGYRSILSARTDNNVREES